MDSIQLLNDSHIIDENVLLSAVRAFTSDPLALSALEETLKNPKFDSFRSTTPFFRLRALTATDMEQMMTILRQMEDENIPIPLSIVYKALLMAKKYPIQSFRIQSLLNRLGKSSLVHPFLSKVKFTSWKVFDDILTEINLSERVLKNPLVPFTCSIDPKLCLRLMKVLASHYCDDACICLFESLSNHTNQHYKLLFDSLKLRNDLEPLEKYGRAYLSQESINATAITSLLHALIKVDGSLSLARDAFHSIECDRSSMLHPYLRILLSKGHVAEAISTAESLKSKFRFSHFVYGSLVFHLCKSEEYFEMGLDWFRECSRANAFNAFTVKPVLHKMAHDERFIDFFQLMQECSVERVEWMHMVSKAFSFKPVKEWQVLMEEAWKSGVLKRTAFTYNTLIALHRFTPSPSIQAIQGLLEEMKLFKITEDANTREHQVFIETQVHKDWEAAYRIVQEMETRKEYITLHSYELLMRPFHGTAEQLEAITETIEQTKSFKISAHTHAIVLSSLRKVKSSPKKRIHHFLTAEEDNVAPNEHAITMALSELRKNPNWTDFTECIQIIERSSSQLQAATYCSILFYLKDQPNTISQSLAVITSMQKSQIPITVHCSKALLGSWTRSPERTREQSFLVLKTLLAFPELLTEQSCRQMLEEIKKSTGGRYLVKGLEEDMTTALCMEHIRKAFEKVRV